MEVFFLSLLVFFAGCSVSLECEFVLTPGDNAQKEMQKALNTVESGCVELQEGTYHFTRTLTMDGKEGITLKGAGRKNTILSFSDQISGGDGLLISNSDNIIVKDFTIRDAVGDALKFRSSDGIVIQRVGAVWSGEPSADNGAYGIYPVLSSNILIEECYAFGASDAGIYVGQSDSAIVRNSTAEGNVAGIEMENTKYADIYNNIVTDNAGGILVFDLPGLTQNGGYTRIFNNTVTKNMRSNFAPGGNIVAQVPSGTGILLLSTEHAEVFNNKVEGNNVAGTIVGSYAALVELGLFPRPEDPDYTLFPENIFIHDNTYSNTNTFSTGKKQSPFGNLLIKSFKGNTIPDIITDGIFAPGSGPSGNLCIQNNEGADFVNLNLPENFPNNLNRDVSPHNCSLEPLTPVEIKVLNNDSRVSI